MEPKYSYTVFYEADPDGGYVASVPALPGCHTQGSTLEEAEERIREAILVYFDSLLAHGDSVPVEQKSYQGTVTVNLADVA
jgi:predicted RNase H-like HicB family nuclease